MLRPVGMLVVTLVACGEKHLAPDEPQAPAVIEQGVKWPPIIDSHVHVTYWPVADKLAKTGIAAVVDLAAPEPSLATKFPITVIAAGPMLTRPNGYPLESWGSDGYGHGCADQACVEAQIDRVAAKGARVIKLALGDRGLDPALVPVAVTRAHARKLKVAVHALTDAAALLAAQAGVDLLAHTPVEPLSDATVAAWKSGAVISTLAAFDSPTTVANLRKLRAAGATILYGTDLGNLRDAGPSETEVRLLEEAGLDDAAIVAAMTTTPAKYWGFAEDPSSYLILERDPRFDARALLSPRAVWLRGHRVR